MTRAPTHVAGIGNAIVDIIGRCDDAFLARHGAAKGHMRLVDAPAIKVLYDAMGPATEISGGSAANTMVGIASLGGRCSFTGKVADDEFGRVFAHDISASGVTFAGRPAPGPTPTSRCLILVTPDGERTMSTYLGVSVSLDASELDANAIANAEILYLEGYLFDLPGAKAAFRASAAIAKSAGRRVALSLSDGFCVDRHRPDFLDFIRGSVDILFANETEITALYQTPSYEAAAKRASGDVALAALTAGANGARLVTRAGIIAIPAEPVAKVVDTTGAGDLFASGVLYGLAEGLPIEVCGRLGCLAAAEIISHIGARPETPLQSLVKAKGLLA